MKLSTLPAETRQFLIIALPLAAAYLAEYAMFVTTKMVVGKLGYQQLAAVGISGHFALEILVVLMGLLSAVGVLAAEAEGGADPQGVGRSVRQGILLATLLAIPATILVWHLDSILIITGQDPMVIAFATPYLRGLSAMVLPVLWFSVLRHFVAAVSRPLIIMVITLAAVFLNYLLTVWLVYGGLGLQPLGVFGAGLATTVVSWLMFIVLILYIYYHSALRGYGLFKSRWFFDLGISLEIMRLGIPVAGITFLEASLFIAASVLSGVIGAKTLAAYEIVISWSGIPFVLAIGLAEATMIRVAQSVGRKDQRAARYRGQLGMALGVGLMTLLIVVPLGFANAITRLFITPEDQGFVEISQITAQLFIIAALFQIFDGLQAIAARALRAFKDNVMPLWIAAFGYWVLGAGGGSVLAFLFGLGGVGLWWGLAMGLLVTAYLLCWRFHRISAIRRFS